MEGRLLRLAERIGRDPRPMRTWFLLREGASVPAAARAEPAVASGSR